VPNEKKKASVVHCKLGKHRKFSAKTTNLRRHLHDTRTGVYSALLQVEKEKTTTSKAHTEAQQPTLAQVKFIGCYHYLDILLIYQSRYDTPILLSSSHNELYCMKPCKMKAPNCALFSAAHRVCYIFPWKIQYRKYCFVYIAINQLKYRLCSCTTGNIDHALVQYFL